MPDPLNPMVVRKRMPICEAVGEYVNGSFEGDLSPERFEEMVRNFKKFPRQVPVYLLVGDPDPEHPDDLDSKVPVGWIEGLSTDGRFLYGDPVKLHGDGARYVADDLVRGASIGSIQGKAYDGTSIGEVLEHVVLTNNPFVKGMNIAARRAKGGDEVRSYFTALKEAPVAEDKKDKQEPATVPAEDTVTLKDKLTASEVLLQEKEGVIRDLTAANANLVEEVKAFRANPQLAMAMKELDQQKRINQANKVRFITARMATDRQIDMDVLRGWYDHDSDEVVLAGFKNSQFKGSIDLLMYHRDSVKKNPSRGFVSGVPQDGETGTSYTAEQKAALKAAGKDPEEMEKTRGAKNLTEFKQRKAAAKG